MLIHHPFPIPQLLTSNILIQLIKAKLKEAITTNTALIQILIALYLDHSVFLPGLSLFSLSSCPPQARSTSAQWTADVSDTLHIFSTSGNSYQPSFSKKCVHHKLFSNNLMEQSKLLYLLVPQPCAIGFYFLSILCLVYILPT